MTILKLHFKKMGLIGFVCGLVLVFQLTMLQITKEPDLSTPLQLLVISEKPDKQARELIDYLKNQPKITIEESPNSLTGADLLKFDSVLKIDPNYEENLSTESKQLGHFTKGLGNRQDAYLLEVIFTKILNQKASNLYQNQLSDLSFNSETPFTRMEDRFAIDYYHEQEKEITAQPIKMGLMGLGFLFSSLTILPYLSKQKKWQIYSKKRVIQYQLLIVSLIFTMWFFELSLFSLLGAKFSFFDLSSIPFLAVISLIFFTMTQTMFLSIYISERKLAVLFIPWLIANMTLGGALWEEPFAYSRANVFLPIAFLIKGEGLLLFLYGSVFFLLWLVFRNRKSIFYNK